MSDLRPLSEQKIFDRVYNHFVTNNQSRAISVWGGCKYQTTEGNVCAIGLFIPKEEYSSDIEGYGVWIVLDRIPTAKVLLENANLDFLADLQIAH